MTTALAEADELVLDPLEFSATDVTGMHELEFSGVDGHRRAGDVAMSVAEAMELPTSAPWALRDEPSARMLDEERPVGAQVRARTRLVLIPKSHLG
jgi:hypothetical protein